ncbi:MAG TPA: hypothetical protein VG223_10010 [Solirubrobacteraceae bacterium]|nr:hypothetical protein [Solirubrobacteraceae bacterium]
MARRLKLRRWQKLVIVVALAGEGIPLLRRGVGVGNVIVRCRQGHLFTTIWIPLASVKSLRLGPYRLQRCPVGPHWSLVTPVDPATLSEDERRVATETRDIRIP